MNTKIDFTGGTHYPLSFWKNVQKEFWSQNHTCDDTKITCCVYKDGTFNFNWGAYWSQSSYSFMMINVPQGSEIPQN